MLLPNHVDLYEYPDNGTELDSFGSPLQRPKSFQDIWTCTTRKGVCYLHFDFPNGACSTDQLRRLRMTLMKIRANPYIKVVLLMGGYDVFSNGIHLNVIEHSHDSIQESHRNINAMNDVMRELFLMTEKLIISVLQAGAGAGGVMLAIAAALVWAHKRIILNPHYKLIGLTGSEYWTHLLPKRVGYNISQELTDSLSPISATDAQEINLINDLIANDVEGLLSCLEERLTDFWRTLVTSIN